MVNYRQRQQALRKGFFGSPLLSACLLTLPILVSAETARADIQTGRSATRALTNSSGRPKGPVIVTPTQRDPLPRVIVKSPVAAEAGKRPAPRILPRTSRQSPGTYPWRLNITATVFWVGEEPTERNPVANHKSSWDSAWRENFGGFDNPDPVCRTMDFRPKTFIPRQNPFYVALPYNDVSRGEHKAEASRVIPWFRREYAGKGQSVCKGRWVQIVYNKRSCFAQWEDCGPFTTEDWPYVFGDKPPVNTQNKGAGIDISPAVRDYLGITGGTAIVHWRFVEFYRIPRGPWSKYGDNNPFVNAGLGAGKKSLQPREDRLRRQQGAIDGSRETQKGTPGITPCAAAAMQRPRILHIFSRYGEVGGEEICFHAITEALGAIADVTPFVYSTEELFHSPHGALTKMGYLLHNRDVEQKLRKCLRENRYDAWIIHNTFPAMSPCVYELALHQPAPVIHYMHNYRSGCLNGVFYRDGAPCFSCQGGNYFPGIMHACWRKNAAYSSLAAAVLYKTRRMGAWSRFSSYIAISRRQRELLIRTGIPEDKIRVIPHFIRQNPAPAAGQPRRDVLYAGRLTQEKGVLQLVQAWELLSPPGRILYLMGDGPLRGELERYISSRHLESIRLTGFIPHEEQGAVRAACGLSVAPSLWEETFGMVVLESWLHGTPVIVTPNGGLPELITHGRNGWIAQEPSVESLAETLHTALKQEERWPSMGAHGQQLLSSTYSPAAWLRSMEALLGELRFLHSSSTPPTS